MNKWNDDDKKRWDTVTLNHCKAMLPDFPPDDDDEQRDRHADLTTLFLASLGKDITFPPVDVLTGKFQSWLMDNYVRPGVADTEYLQVSIQRTIGGEVVTYTLGAHHSIRSGAGRSIAYDRLIDAIGLEFGRYERDRAKVPPNNERHYNGLDMGGQTVSVPATRLDVTVKNGKKQFKVKCGQWNTHGVPFYAEHIKMADVNPDSIPLEGWDLSGFSAVVQLENGKAKRVLKLVRDATG